MFLIAFDSFIAFWCFRIQDRRLGILRACADDVGSALSGLRHILALHGGFRLAALFAGLEIRIENA